MPEPIFNVVVTVVDLIPAASPEEAIAKLTDRLAWAGFQVHVDGDDTQDAFESEPLDEEQEEQHRRDWLVVQRMPSHFPSRRS